MSRGSARQMPLVAYFRNVGAALLALIFLADFCFPNAPVAQKAAVYPPVIRIHSDRKWPARVVFDTTQTLVTVAEPVGAGIAIAALIDTIEPRAVQSGKPVAHDAFALMHEPQARRPETTANQHKRQRKPHYRVARSNRYAKQQMVHAMQQRRFAWFGFPQWR